MLNTRLTADGITVTDDQGKDVGRILYRNGLWVAVPIYAHMDHKAFKSMKAAEYYMLAAYLEEQEEAAQAA